ncbi:MAG TPA: hypothetical protein DDY16_06790 [Tenacibaculum sp.]|nr:hypothetical protein [Tenacibaculum sp.]HBI40639.1 hypothetical protein [Tenacibaculum sp.]
MSVRKIQFIFSLLFLVGYLFLLVIILYVEVSDSLNMQKGENSLIGEVKILLGVLTGAVAQILNFWFNANEPIAANNTLSETNN